MNRETRHVAIKGKKALMLATILGLFAHSQGLLADLKADTNTIFNWAEVKFPTLLPSRQPTQTIENQWYFRAYPSTDIYTGVNIQNNGVYYISGNDLRNGGAPTFFATVPEALKVATANACDPTKLPAGYSITQSGDTVSIKTNGCIPEPLEEPDYCPQSAQVGGISLKSTVNFTQTTNGQSDAIDLVSCSKNVSASTATPTIQLDLCYTDRTTPSITTVTKGKMVFEKVDDCFKTNANTVIDIANDDFWVNQDGAFVMLKKLISKK